MDSVRLRQCLVRLEQLVYPRRCQVCNKCDEFHLGVCEECMENLPWCESVCSVCGLPVSRANLVCGRCQKRPPSYDSLHAAFWYEEPVNQMILDYKYFNRWYVVEILINLFVQRMAYQQDAVLIPMPSHPSRVRSRGFNAVFELLRVLQPKGSMQADFSYLQRIKNTDTQAGKTEPQRRNNMKNAFCVNSRQVYPKVILFDDVVTTGTTVNEASRCLKKHGVDKVQIWALARTKLR